MSIANNAVSVTTTATRLDPNEGPGPVGSFAVTNTGAGTIYLGGPNVTTSNGVPLSAGQTFSADLAPNDALYAITASGTQDCRIMQLGSAG